MGLLSIFGIKSRSELVMEAITEGAVIIDVRTAQEFKGGHISNSINIPLQHFKVRISTIKKKKKTIITCCKSGGRSRTARNILQKNGVKCVNGGSWGGLNYIIH